MNEQVYRRRLRYGLLGKDFFFKAFRPALHKGILFRWVKQPGDYVCQSPAPVAEVKNERSYTSTPGVRLRDVDSHILCTSAG